jgi:hypothetical protein
LLLWSIEPSYELYLRKHPYVPAWELNYLAVARSQPEDNKILRMSKAHCVLVEESFFRRSFSKKIAKNSQNM